MNENIGKNLMRLAKGYVVICLIIGIAGFCVGFFIMTDGGDIFGISMMIGSIIFALFGSILAWPLYGFGKLIDDNAAIRANTLGTATTLLRMEQTLAGIKKEIASGSASVTIPATGSQPAQASSTVSCGKSSWGICDQCHGRKNVRSWAVNGVSVALCDECMEKIQNHK